MSSIAPSSGTTFGGTPVTITGMNFESGASVAIGGTPATSLLVVGPTTITAVTGSRGAGSADVVVTIGTRTARLADAFTYVAPSSTPNAPPVITALTAQGTRPRQPAAFADLDEEIEVTVVVSDVETSAQDLVYEWSAESGTLTGSGASVRWRAPSAAAFAAPGTIPITVAVIERYIEPDTNGLPIQREHEVTESVVVRVHDSVREVSDMARKFLLLFSDSDVSPEDVVQDFLPNCGDNGNGRENELEDVRYNRANFVITDYSIFDPRVTVNFGGRCTLLSDRFRPADACALVAVQWTDTRLSTAQVNTVTGTDQVTAIYNGTRWGLCDSDFQGTATILDGATMPGSWFKP